MQVGGGMRLAVDSNRSQLLTNVEKLLEEGTEPDLAKPLRWAVDNWTSVTKEAKENAGKIKAALPAATKAGKDAGATFVAPPFLQGLAPGAAVAPRQMDEAEGAAVAVA